MERFYFLYHFRFGRKADARKKDPQVREMKRDRQYDEENNELEKKICSDDLLPIIPTLIHRVELANHDEDEDLSTQAKLDLSLDSVCTVPEMYAVRLTLFPNILKQLTYEQQEAMKRGGWMHIELNAFDQGFPIGRHQFMKFPLKEIYGMYAIRISRDHCRICYDDGAFHHTKLVLIDNSTNGVLLNGKTIGFTSLTLILS